MRCVKSLLAAGAATLISSMAFAADMPIAPPPMYAPAPPVDFGGWYLRGDIGMTNQRMKSIDNPGDPNAVLFRSTGMGFDSATLFDLGIGYQFNNWFRADVIGQWRGRANLHGSNSIPFTTTLFPGTAFANVNNYDGSKSEAVVMANAYVDLGTWWCVTPYIGAGIGASYNRISGFRDDGLSYINGAPFPAVTYGADAGKWNFAWALHAGLGYKVTPNVTLELGYSYMNLGDAVTGPTNSFDGITVVNGSNFVIKDITSHDVKLGVRWNLDSPPVYAPPPLITKG
ncbi:outer surface protein (OMPA-like) heat-resistant agglutinin 1 [Bradyrhizobium sp. NAS80.1]|uniref:outer membrane protein n=1 Tax=Bradyrhizobium sp. NAS80.1 TaxID=1680159 RepID=UPI0009676902|nr:outer membrane beta-barrel protein [Bradyrhizobium sp. NAS80.1]OKO75329.1 outer surface protein (OMPA-like) heat-resistant agglutinin 1 [Bradyrhizobium sp. NAS80.1]